MIYNFTETKSYRSGIYLSLNPMELSGHVYCHSDLSLMSIVRASHTCTVAFSELIDHKSIFSSRAQRYYFPFFFSYISEHGLVNLKCLVQTWIPDPWSPIFDPWSWFSRNRFVCKQFCQISFFFPWKGKIQLQMNIKIIPKAFNIQYFLPFYAIYFNHTLLGFQAQWCLWEKCCPVIVNTSLVDTNYSFEMIVF